MRRSIWAKLLGSGAAFVALASIAVAQTSLPEKEPAAAQPAPEKVSAAAQPSTPDKVSAAQPAQPAIMESPPGNCCGSDGPYTIWDTVFLSIFNKHAPKREWTPLYATNFFSEGWLQPHINPPDGSGGSLRQGWIGVPDAFFNRQIIFGIYNYAQGTNGRQNEQNGAVLIESPISRRWDVGFIVPYVDNLSGNGRASATSFGDVTIENRFLLHETKDLTVSLNINIRTPTGDANTGNDRTVLIPYLAFYKDLGYNGWSVRGAAGVEDPLSGPNNTRFNTLTQSLGIGRTLTPHDVRFFGDFTPNVCFNAREDLDTGNNAFFSITPGFRTHLGNDFFFLFGVDVPVSPNAGFRERFNFILLKGF
jgi:hypothetical protein